LEDDAHLDKRKKKRLSDRLQESVGTIMRASGAMFRRDAERYGITFAQFRMLKMVRAHGPMTITEMSRLMMIRVPTASRMIDGLCEKGLLTKSRSESDSRVTMLSLTAESERRMRQLGQVQRRVIEEALEGEPEEKLEYVVEFMSKLADRLAAGGREPRAAENGRTDERER
jgi:MarR family transcriptional regulator, organic hydroperoxide resistance regulator